MPSSKKLLETLLRALVQEYGIHDVESALLRISKLSDNDYTNHLHDKYKREFRKSKILASDIVDRSGIQEEKKSILRGLAVRFDRKEILPSLPDARQFLIMMGISKEPVKDRLEAFQKIIDALSSLSVEQLEQITKSSMHTGPSRLGPLSEAITTAAESLPRFYKRSDS